MRSLLSAVRWPDMPTSEPSRCAPLIRGSRAAASSAELRRGTTSRTVSSAMSKRTVSIAPPEPTPWLANTRVSDRVVVWKCAVVVRVHSVGSFKRDR
ncbi:hypothetical protein D3C87_1341590 [compost metagenome]